MKSRKKLSKAVQQRLCCPICRAKLEFHDEQYQCQNNACNFSFPIVNGIPILIDERISIFSIDDFVKQYNTNFFSSQTTFEQAIKKFLPDISKNIKGKENFHKLAKLLLDQSSSPVVLVIGGSILGAGMKAIMATPNLELVESDVSFGPRTALVCDAHCLPFEDISFDCVMVQAVLEHVVDPWQCVEESIGF